MKRHQLKLSSTTLAVFQMFLVMENLTDRTTNALCLSGEKKKNMAVTHCPRAQEESKEREKSYIPLLLPVDSNLSFKMAHTKNQRRLAN